MKKEIHGYQRKYQDIDMDAVHESNMFLQTRNLYLQNKVSYQGHLIKEFKQEKQETEDIF